MYVTRISFTVASHAFSQGHAGIDERGGDCGGTVHIIISRGSGGMLKKISRFLCHERFWCNLRL